MLTVEQAKQTTLANVPIDTVDLLPNECPICHKPLVISLFQTEVSCVDPYCPGKVAVCCEQFFHDLGITSISRSMILDVCRFFPLTTPIDLFTLEESDLNDQRFKGQRTPWHQLIQRLASFRELTLAELIYYAHVPYLDFDTVQKLTTPSLTTGTLEDITERVVFNPEPHVVYPQAMAIFEQWHRFVPRLMRVIKSGKMTFRKGLPTKMVTIDQSIGGHWQSTEDFKAYLWENYAKTMHFLFLPNVSEQTEVVISQYTSGTAKTAQANAQHIPILTGDAFIEELLADV